MIGNWVPMDLVAVKAIKDFKVKLDAHLKEIILQENEYIEGQWVWLDCSTESRHGLELPNGLLLDWNNGTWKYINVATIFYYKTRIIEPLQCTRRPFGPSNVHWQQSHPGAIPVTQRIYPANPPDTKGLWAEQWHSNLHCCHTVPGTWVRFLAWGHCLCGVCTFSVSARVSSRCSDFLPQSKTRLGALAML